MTSLRTGTDNAPIAHAQHSYAPQQSNGTDYGALDTPAVWRSSRETAASHVQALQEKGVDTYDIPAFLRKQAD
jgi:cell division protein FtsZ